MAVNLLRYGAEMQAFTVRLGQEPARAAQQYRGLVSTLQDSIDNLLIGPLSNLNFFEQQRLAEQQFEELAEAAMQGSTEAMGQLPEAGRRYLELTAQLYGNAGTSYDSAIQRVIAVQEQAQRAAEQHANEQDQIAQHAANAGALYNQAIQAVAEAIADGTVTSAEIERIRAAYDAVAAEAARMGPVGDLFVNELSGLMQHIASDTLTPAVIDALRGRVGEFNAALDQGVHVFMNTFGRLPSGIDSVTASVARSLDRLYQTALEQERQAGIRSTVQGVGANVSDILSANVRPPTRQETGRSSGDWTRLRDVARGHLNLTTGTFGNIETPGGRQNVGWLESYAPVLSDLARQMQDLVGGTLPQVYLSAHRENGLPQLWMRVGDGSTLKLSGDSLALENVAGQFLQMLKRRIEGVDEQVAKIMLGIDYRPAGLGPQGGLVELARQLAEGGQIPGFASGGIHTGGLRIVGEHGPELEYTGPSRIYSAPDTQRILAGNDNSEVVKELRTLVQQQGRVIEVLSEQTAAARADAAAQREELAAVKREMRQQGRRPNGRAA